MNLLDVRTVVFSQLITDALCTFVLVLLWLQNRKRSAGMAFWVTDFIFQTAAILLIILRGTIPDWLSIGVSSPLVIAGAFLGYLGLERFIGRRDSQIHNYFLLGGGIFIHFYFVFAQPDLEARNLNVTAGLLIFSAQCAWLMLRRAGKGLIQITRSVGWVFAIFSLVSVIRILVTLANPQANNDFFKSGIYDTLILLSFQILLIGLTFGLVLMVNQRLLSNVSTQEEKFAKAFHSSPYAIIITRLSDGLILDVNRGFEQYSGFSSCEVVGKTTIELALWVDDTDRLRILSNLSSGNGVQGREIQFRTKSGGLLTGLYYAEILVVEGQPLVMSSISDITERKQAEESLKENNATLNGIIENTHALIFSVDQSYRYTSFNQKHAAVMKAIYGVEISNGRSILEYMTVPADRDGAKRNLDRALAGEQFVESAYSGEDARSRLYFEVAHNPIRSESGQVVGVSVFSNDVTERKRIEKRVTDLAKFPEENPNPVLRIDLDGRVVYANEAANVLLKSWNCQVGETLSEDLHQFVKSVASEGKVREQEIVMAGMTYLNHWTPVAGTDYVNLYGRNITRRKQAENAVIAERELFRTTLGSIGDAVITTDPQGIITFLNAVAEKLINLPASEAVGRPIEQVFSIINEVSHQPAENPVVQVLKTHAIMGLANHSALVTQDHQMVPIEDSAAPILHSGEILGVVMVFHDVTIKRKIEQALQYQAALLDHLDVAVVASDEQFQLTAWNRAAEELYGWKAGEVLGKIGLEFTRTEFLEPDKSEMLERISSMGHWRGQATQAKRDGSRFPVEISSIVLHDPEGQISGYLSLNQDITERKKIEDSLRENQSLLNQTQRITKVGGWEYNLATQRVTWTDEVYRIYGVAHTYDPRSPDQDIQFYAPEDQKRLAEAFRRAVELGEPYELELQLDSALGKRLWVRTSGQAERKGNEIVRVFGNIMDITERKLADETIQLYTKRLAAVNRLDRVISSSLDLDDIYDAFVVEMENFLPFDRTSIVLVDDTGENWQIIRQWTAGTPAFQPIVWNSIKGTALAWVVAHQEAYLEEVLGEQTDWIEHKGLREEGIQCRVLLPLILQGKVTGLLTLASRQPNAYQQSDLELLQSLADQLAIAVQNANLYQQARLSAEELEQRVQARTAQLENANKDLVSFSYSVSHDLRAPLRAINGFSQILARRHRDGLDEEGKHYLDNVVEASTRMGILIDDLLQYSRVGRSSVHHQMISIDDVFVHALADLAPRIAETQAVIELPAVGTMPRILSDPTILGQIFTNIISNALTYHKAGVPPVIQVSYQAEAGHHLFGVRDNGIGIPSEYLEKIFAVFQRLHSSEEYPGTGIGLAIVKKSAELLGGRVWAESKEGVESTFWIQLPKE